MAAAVDVNSAERRALCRLPGIGGGKADRIIAGRPFASWEDLCVRVHLPRAALGRLLDQAAPLAALLEARGAAADETSDEGSGSEVEAAGAAGDEAAAGPGLLPKHLARWERRHGTHFRAERFFPGSYHDAARDGADAAAYYARLPSPEAPDYEALSELLQARQFGGRSRVLLSWLDRQEDGRLLCIYTGRELSDASGALLAKCNEEHCVPQSWQASGEAHTGRDIHHIFGASVTANGLRGNRPFGEPPLFLPERNRGALARATLYVLVAYPGALDPRRLPPQSLAWLVRTAAEEPVSLWEQHRNFVAFAHQGNRNPFVDHPNWALLLHFQRGFAAP